MPSDDLAQRILIGLAQAGVHRAGRSQNLDPEISNQPCSFYDWRLARPMGLVYIPTTST